LGGTEKRQRQTKARHSRDIAGDGDGDATETQKETETETENINRADRNRD
jgi:hypothetical protein